MNLDKQSVQLYKGSFRKILALNFAKFSFSEISNIPKRPLLFKVLPAANSDPINIF